MITLPLQFNYDQNFLSYTTASAVTYVINTEASYDWQEKDWTVSIYTGVAKILKANNQLISGAAGLRYWAASTDNSPKNALRVTLMFLFPRYVFVNLMIKYRRL